MLYAVLIAIACVWLGLFIGFYLPYPPSFFITFLAFLSYLVTRRVGPQSLARGRASTLLAVQLDHPSRERRAQAERSGPNGRTQAAGTAPATRDACVSCLINSLHHHDRAAEVMRENVRHALNVLAERAREWRPGAALALRVRAHETGASGRAQLTALGLSLTGLAAWGRDRPRPRAVGPVPGGPAASAGGG